MRGAGGMRGCEGELLSGDQERAALWAACLRRGEVLAGRRGEVLTGRHGEVLTGHRGGVEGSSGGRKSGRRGRIENEVRWM